MASSSRGRAAFRATEPDSNNRIRFDGRHRDTRCRFLFSVDRGTTERDRYDHRSKPTPRAGDAPDLGDPTLFFPLALTPWLSWPWVLVLLWFGTVGLLVGSYLNVVVYRLPRGLSTVTPRSRCPSCEEPIRARDNVPVLSYLLLRGRCRSCQVKISPRYPAVEATTGVLFCACLWRFGVSIDTVVAACFCALLLALALIDVEFFLLPDRLTYPGIAIGLAASFFVGWTNPAASVLGALLGAGILLAMIGLWLLVRREWGMGLGDVKMLAMIGAFLGMWGMFATLFISTTAGALVGLVLLRSGDGLKTRLPFGVFLSVGALTALFFGQSMISYYLTFF